jgi:hypothetical protein
MRFDEDTWSYGKSEISNGFLEVVYDFLQCFVAGDDHDRHHPPPPEAEPHREEVAKALDDAFKRFTLQGQR